MPIFEETEHCHDPLTMEKIEKRPCRETGAPGRRILAVAAWRSEDRALRALLSALKEQIPCAFELINLESPADVHFRMSSRALFNRIRLYDAVVFVLPGSDFASSPALGLPEERLPFKRHFLRRIPAGYLIDGSPTPRLEAAVEAHARAWRLLPLGLATNEEGGTGLESLATALLRAIE